MRTNLPRLIAGALTISALLFAGPALAEDEEESASVETPAEAFKKSGSSTMSSGDADASFGGGMWLVEQPDSDLEEPLPTGTRSDFERSGYEIVHSDRQVEVVVDKNGQIYGDRNYRGIIPGRRNVFSERRWQRMQGKKRKALCWQGYVQMEGLTRVFFQLTDPAPQFEVNKIDAQTIQVVFDRTRIHLFNNQRRMPTKHFRGPVVEVDGRYRRGKAIYTIKLKEAANFLYRFEAPFLYIDFEK